MSTSTATPVAPVNVQFPHPTDPTQVGPVVQFPDEQTAVAHSANVWSQLKNETSTLYDEVGQVVGAFSQGLGGPSTLKEAYQDVKNTPTGFAHPYESLKAAVSGVVGGLNSGPILDAAKQSWDAGDKVTATRHFVNALIPFVGANSDLAGDELISGQTGKAVGHTLAAVAPFILGTGERPSTQATAAGGVPVAGTPVAEIGKQLAVREHGEAGLPGTVGEPFTKGETSPVDEKTVPTFFSKAAQIATDKLPASATGDQILATLKNNGVKQSEMDWLGLPDYLQGKAKVSKADVEQFIDEHKIELEETTLGGREHLDSALADLRKQRDQAMAVNNRTYADDLRYHPETPSLFNAMKEGQDVDGIIAKMPPNLQESARKFVDSENQIHAISKQMLDLENQPANKPARFGQYTLPGDKQNYKELLLRLPEQDNISALKDELADADAERTHYLQTLRPVPGDVELRFQDAQKAVRQAENKSTAFKSSHFDEPDILAHVRFDDRTMPDGKKALFLEEVQSDWAQKGKREGFANPAPTKLPDGIYITPDDDQFQVVNREGNPLLRRTFASESEARAAALQHYGEGAGNPGVPDMPFKQDWHELAMKRMLRHAAENGYDQLAWTTGEQQAERYDLSKHIGRVTYDPTDSTLQAFDPSGNNVLIETVDPTANAISEYIGKEPAQKLMGKIDAYKSAAEGEDEPDIPELKGLDLKVGGEWAKALYDRAIPRFLNKYASKWGAKVDQSEISTTNPGTLRYEIVDPKGQVQDAFRNRQGAEDAVRGYQESHRGPGKWTIHDNGTTEKVWTIPITHEMKKSVLQGQPIAKAEQPSWQGIALSKLGNQAA
jgi:hypothetical protein